MNNSAWKRARKKVELERVRVHDLKHTFGRRLRAAGVSFEDRQDLNHIEDYDALLSGRVTESVGSSKQSHCKYRRQTLCLTMIIISEIT
jgi:hypothetical protein